MPGGTPYALGRFRDSGGSEFCGAVIGTGVVPLAALPPAETTVGALLAAWPSNEKVLSAAADEAVASGRWAALARPADELTPLAPYRPRADLPERGELQDPRHPAHGGRRGREG